MRNYIRDCIFVLISFIAVGCAVAGEAKQTTSAKKWSEKVIYLETTINRQSSKVWPHLLDIGSWVKDFTFVPVSGKPNEEGEIQRIYSTKMPIEEQNKHTPHLHKKIKLVPYKHYSFVNPHKYFESPEYNEGLGYFVNHVFTLNEYNGKTNLSLAIYIEYETSSQQDYAKIENKALPEFALDVQQRWRDKYLPRLKELVEK